jgi:hypothetical protein
MLRRFCHAVATLSAFCVFPRLVSEPSKLPLLSRTPSQPSEAELQPLSQLALHVVREVHKPRRTRSAMDVRLPWRISTLLRQAIFVVAWQPILQETSM